MLSTKEQSLYMLSAESVVSTIFALEPKIVENTPNELFLYIQTDAKGQEADVRDIIIQRPDITWEIGLSIKHNHTAVKHSRLSKRIDFGKIWYGVNCSEDYWQVVTPIFDFLQSQGYRGTLFSDIPQKEDIIYLPILSAFVDEVRRAIRVDSSVPAKLVAYLLSRYDFYKIISNDSRRVTIIQSFNMHGTLNQASDTQTPLIQVPQINLPSSLLYIGLRPDSKTTVLACFDNGWQFSFRIHNAEKIAKPSLKFDVQIVGMPSEVNIEYICRWDIGDQT